MINQLPIEKQWKQHEHAHFWTAPQFTNSKIKPNNTVTWWHSRMNVCIDIFDYEICNFPQFSIHSQFAIKLVAKLVDVCCFVQTVNRKHFYEGK